MLGLVLSWLTEVWISQPNPVLRLISFRISRYWLVVLLSFSTGSLLISYRNVVVQGWMKSLSSCIVKVNQYLHHFYKRTCIYLSDCVECTALVENGKFLLAARKFRRATSTDYIISINSEDMSRGSTTYVGKLR